MINKFAVAMLITVYILSLSAIAEATAVLTIENYVWVPQYSQWYTADSATGPYISSDPVRFMVEVGNVGNEPMYSTTVDNPSGRSSLGTIYPGQIRTIYYTLPWVSGQQTTYVSGTASWGFLNLKTTSGSDNAYYFGSSSAIDIEKYVWNGTDWVDGDFAYGSVLSSNPVQFKIIVTNTGNTRAENLIVTDDKYGSVPVSPYLNPSESTEATYSLSLVSGGQNNIASASCYNQYTGAIYVDNDNAWYFGLVPPKLAPIGAKSVNENELLTFTISATDADGDDIIYSATGLPDGATFNATTAKFSWTPGSEDVGSYDVTFSATANGMSDSETIAITVIDRQVNMVLAGIYEDSQVHSIVISGNYAYVADYMNGLAIMDITDPSNPSSVAICDTPGPAQSVVVSGDYAYVADNENGLAIVDISDPFNPSYVVSYDTPGRARSVAVSDDYVYIADWDGIVIVDVTNPLAPTIAGTFETAGVELGVDVAGNYAYVTDYQFGLTIVDISDPSNPLYVTSCDTPGYAIGVAVSGDYAYVADSENGLAIVDISDPSNPFYAGSYDTLGSSTGVAVSGNYAYVADDWNGLVIVDISSPSNSSFVGSYDTSGSATSVAVSGNYVYIADFTNGLVILRIFDTGPVLASIDNKSINKNQLLEFTISATDADGDAITYSADVLPSGATLDAATGVFSWTPGYDQAGTYDVTFTATAKGLTDSETIYITVQATPDEQWSKTFGGSSNDSAYSFYQTFDGGYILAGYTESYGAGKTDAFLIKVDNNGNYVWNQAFGGAGFDYATSVQQISNGEYIYAGYTNSYGAGGSEAWLVRVDNLGNQLWSKTFGGSSNDYANSLDQTSDGGYILAGLTQSYGVGKDDAWLIKTNSNGIEQWNKTFGGPEGDYVHSVQQTSDGGYILAGTVHSYGAGDADAWLIKTNSDGTEQWNKTFGGTNYDGAYSVQQTSDGGYIISGLTESYGAGESYDAWLIKTNSDGTEQWNKTFGGSGFDDAYSVDQTSDGGYITAGHTTSYGAGGYDAWLIKTNSKGIEQWNKTFGGTYWDWAYSVQQTSDDGYILAGDTHSYGNGYGDAWLIKVAPETVTNKPPELDVIGNKSVNENVLLEFIISATDADDDVITYSATGLPVGATFDATTATFSWTPGNGDAGNYNVEFFATANGQADSENIVITVSDWNPWNDPYSEGGEAVTLSELQEAIYDWRFGIVVPTGEMVDLTRLQELIYSWRFG